LGALSSTAKQITAGADSDSDDSIERTINARTKAVQERSVDVARPGETFLSQLLAAKQKTPNARVKNASSSSDSDPIPKAKQPNHDDAADDAFW
jgi:hypothetical protein